jgi:hypothetical protein
MAIPTISERAYHGAMVFAAMALQILIGAGFGHIPGEIPGWARPETPDAPVAQIGAETDAGGASPACRADFCQPRVSIPGREQSFDTRGRRTELALAAIDRLGLGVVSSIARAANTSGVQIDYQPPQLDSTSSGRGGLGKLNVGVRWRLDAWSGPVWAGAAR